MEKSIERLKMQFKKSPKKEAKWQKIENKEK